MDFTTKTIFFITLSSLLFVGNAIPSSRDIHVVRHNLQSNLVEFCKKTTNPTLCQQTIQPSYTNNVFDPYKALGVEIEATLNQTKKIIGIISELREKHETSKSLKDSLDICKDQYNSILGSIKETKDAIGKRDVRTIKFKFSAVLSYQASCKDAFEGMEKQFPFAKDSDVEYQLGGNCLDIIADLEKSEPKNEAPLPQSPPSASSNVIGTIS